MVKLLLVRSRNYLMREGIRFVGKNLKADTNSHKLFSPIAFSGVKESLRRVFVLSNNFTGLKISFFGQQ